VHALRAIWRHKKGFFREISRLEAMVRTTLFDFDLPTELIALRPVSPRDSARMMVVWDSGEIEHRYVSDLPDYLEKGDALVVNDTKVLPARLHGVRVRENVPAKIEILLHKRLDASRFAVLARPARKLAPGDRLDFDGLSADVIARGENGEAEIAFASADLALDTALAARGEMPLPPYIAGKRKPDIQDREDYQTTFARKPGSAAAPTAGLHFTPALFSALERKGVARETITLHVGLGTFLPVTAQEIAQHRMHAERAILSPETAARLNDIRRNNGHIAAVGTTSLRTLESAASENGIVNPFVGETDIFITPGYHFRTVDILLTNFHLPRSTLFMLVSAFMGLDLMKRAYQEAIEKGYRFYSYGDACLLRRAP
jgi:S-adenosylmethionine:tRNA ribosyltransferase-isomerase